MAILDDQIALYLNLATTKTRAAGGSLRWLTGHDGVNIEVGAGQSQETQCMVIGSCIWIANNDDADTEFQFAFLNRLGIDSYSKLAKHVEAHSIRLLPAHVGLVNVRDTSRPGERLLARMTEIANGTAMPEAGFALPVDQAACQRFGLNQAASPPSAGIVFVRGSYQGVGGDNEHAEQKLLAAYGKYLRHGGTSMHSRRLHVSGCKSACQTCRGVLERVQERLRVGESRNRLGFDDPNMLDDRNAVGMGAAHPAGIKALDVDHYFPA